MKNLNLPIFPLPVFLLPNGITRLRIFESRYLKMVKIATQGQGFVISPNNLHSNTGMPIWGSWVEIINFDQGSDGVLEIDVKSNHLVEISLLEKDNDNLLFGNITIIDHWSDKKASLDMFDENTSKRLNENSNGDLNKDFNEIIQLSISLDLLFKNNHLLGNLYQEKSIENSSWVVARWLEFLPLPISVKATFIAKNSYDEAKKLVQSIILNQ